MVNSSEINSLDPYFSDLIKSADCWEKWIALDERLMYSEKNSCENLIWKYCFLAFDNKGVHFNYKTVVLNYRWSEAEERKIDECRWLKFSDLDVFFPTQDVSLYVESQFAKINVRWMQWDAHKMAKQISKSSNDLIGSGIGMLLGGVVEKLRNSHRKKALESNPYIHIYPLDISNPNKKDEDEIAEDFDALFEKMAVGLKEEAVEIKPRPDQTGSVAYFDGKVVYCNEKELEDVIFQYEEVPEPEEIEDKSDSIKSYMEWKMYKEDLELRRKAQREEYEYRKANPILLDQPNVKSIVFPMGMENINFRQEMPDFCNLEVIRLPKSIISIRDDAFSGGNLQELRVYITTKWEYETLKEKNRRAITEMGIERSDIQKLVFIIDDLEEICYVDRIMKMVHEVIANDVCVFFHYLGFYFDKKYADYIRSISAISSNKQKIMRQIEYGKGGEACVINGESVLIADRYSVIDI